MRLEEREAREGRRAEEARAGTYTEASASV